MSLNRFTSDIYDLHHGVITDSQAEILMSMLEMVANSYLLQGRYLPESIEIAKEKGEPTTLEKANGAIKRETFHMVQEAVKREENIYKAFIDRVDPDKFIAPLMSKFLLSEMEYFFPRITKLVEVRAKLCSSTDRTAEFCNETIRNAVSTFMLLDDEDLAKVRTGELSLLD